MATAIATGSPVGVSFVPFERRKHRVRPNRRVADDAKAPIAAGDARSDHLPPVRRLSHRRHHNDRLRVRQHQPDALPAAADADRRARLPRRHRRHVADRTDVLPAVERRNTPSEAGDGAANEGPAARPRHGFAQEAGRTVAEGATRPEATTPAADQAETTECPRCQVGTFDFDWEKQASDVI